MASQIGVKTIPGTYGGLPKVPAESEGENPQAREEVRQEKVFLDPHESRSRRSAQVAPEREIFGGRRVGITSWQLACAAVGLSISFQDMMGRKQSYGKYSMWSKVPVLFIAKTCTGWFRLPVALRRNARADRVLSGPRRTSKHHRGTAPPDPSSKTDPNPNPEHRGVKDRCGSKKIRSAQALRRHHALC